MISVGNLRVGGSGKTPVVAEIARLLIAAGERPAVLTRGYGRQVAPAGVTVVSDGQRVLADVGSAGDEPLMLARQLPGVPVLVSVERYQAGVEAEKRFGTTVHLLDDGFQHLTLARDVELVVMSEDDLLDMPLPGGRLREPVTSAAAADAILVPCEDEGCVRRVAGQVGVNAAFRVNRTLGPVEAIRAEWSVPTPAVPVLAVAAIERPERFFNDLMVAGWTLAARRAFRDHHWFTQRDVDAILDEVRVTGAAAVLTTCKDAVRLEAFGFGGLPVGVVPLRVSIEPAVEFKAWLMDRVARARRAA